MQINHLTQARKLDVDLINKKERTWHLVNVDVRADQSKSKRKWKTGEISGPCSRTENIMGNKDDCSPWNNDFFKNGNDTVRVGVT